MNWTHWIAIGSIMAGLSVVVGAFGAHGLRERLSPEMLQVYEIGARYQMYHALAILAVGLVQIKIDHPMLTVAGWCFVLGIVIFSGTLYALSLTGIRILGMITPVGGAIFILGWAAMAYSALKPN